MIRLLFSSFLAVFLLAETAVSQRTISASPSFEAYRSVGEVRVWSFLLKDSVLGQLQSQIVRKCSIDGVDGYVIKEDLNLDYNFVQSSLEIKTAGEHYVASDGAYLGDNLEITINGKTERFVLERNGEKIEGYITREGEEIEQSHKVTKNTFAIDNNFIDQYELYFAMRDIKVGDQITDSIFMPQSGLMAHIKGEVINFSWQRLHSKLLDSVFVVRLSEPQPLELFINKDRRLLKLYDPSQNLRAYLDVVQQTSLPKPIRPVFTMQKLGALLPNFLIYLLAGAIVALFFVGRDFRRKEMTYAVLAGLVSIVAIVWVQIPLQEYLLTSSHAPGVSAEPPSFFKVLLGMIPAGFIQESLKILAVFAFASIGKIQMRHRILIGAGFGATLGVVEACYLTGMLPLTGLLSWSLLERISMITFHTTTGALLGHATTGGRSRMLYIYVLMIIINTVLRTLPYLVQADIFTAPVMHLVLGFAVIGLLLGVVIYFKKTAMQT
ncbi:MAG: hypothetical protein U9N55_04315 [candidate division Zixibacteria bacterium]|nr:hypothetical protein [candidate division Zixibacteria bacterium]